MVSWENNDAIEQHKGEIIVETTIMANLNSLKILQPGVPSSSVIYTCPRAVRLAWQASWGWIYVEQSSDCPSVAGSIPDLSFWFVVRKSLVRGLFHHFHFIQRNTAMSFVPALAPTAKGGVCPAWFFPPHSPSLAMTKLPLMKHSGISRPPRSLTSPSRKHHVNY